MVIISEITESLAWQNSKNKTKKKALTACFLLQLTLFLSVGHLGLEIHLVETHRLRCLPSAQLVQTNRTEEIT